MRHLLMTAALSAMPLMATAQDFTEDQIKQLALQAILENPQIIMDAVAILDEQRTAAQAAANAELLQERRDFLENDPNAPFMGNADASAVIVEFFDYNCPYCKRAANDVKSLLSADNDVRVVYREWPILGEGSVFAARGHWLQESKASMKKCIGALWKCAAAPRKHRYWHWRAALDWMLISYL